MGSLHWYIARHYLGAGRGRGLLSLITWIALGGVTVGVTALIVVIAVMTGMQKDLRAKILESTPHIFVLEQRFSTRCSPSTASSGPHRSFSARFPL
jgi:lipoprotein-releasing system permease protein